MIGVTTTGQPMAIYELDGIAPRIAPSAWVADTAAVIGDVELGEGSSVWFGAVLRGDGEPIRIGRSSSVQDGSVIHTDLGFPATVGNDVTVGHQVTLHGCSVGDGALIGIRAVVLNGAVIGPNCLVGAGALVTEGAAFPEGSLILGAPAKAVRQVTPAQIARLREGAARYGRNAERFRARLRRIGPAA
jgi:carbonic anhydrase/acetyltransferase-like protein (isoleucine patch superfamily)